ncbi:hypothetical protein YC2023_099467 [Brassica napus]
MSNPWSRNHRASALFPPPLTTGDDRNSVPPLPADPPDLAQYLPLSPSISITPQSSRHSPSISVTPQSSRYSPLPTAAIVPRLDLKVLLLIKSQLKTTPFSSLNSLLLFTQTVPPLLLLLP